MHKHNRLRYSAVLVEVNKRCIIPALVEEGLADEGLAEALAEALEGEGGLGGGGLAEALAVGRLSELD